MKAVVAIFGVFGLYMAICISWCASFHKSPISIFSALLWQPTPAPTSKNYAEIRERLRLRLKKKKNKDNPCAKGHDLVPISQLSKMQLANATAANKALAAPPPPSDSVVSKVRNRHISELSSPTFSTCLAYNGVIALYR